MGAKIVSIFREGLCIILCACITRSGRCYSNKQTDALFVVAMLLLVCGCFTVSVTCMPDANVLTHGVLATLKKNYHSFISLKPLN